ncbi:CopG family transcriptional regulator [Candidatus Woesearchaeota archaeon]|jgi:ABC-type microcin C transport system permease subunit YejB|nr:CopG family transcriptional regulator [Candidatus Woesearchaeota archaeon]|tara:strand:+ start:2141 stop:2281 length:141 start_codon:yes stop_codon:yes gene_type:complete
MTKRIQVNLDEDLIEIIRKMKGFGKKDAERLKNIIVAYLSEKGKIG